VISAFNSLTLSPALSALLLRPHDAPKDWLTRGMDRCSAGFFRWFNGWFGRRSEATAAASRGIVQRKSIDDGRLRGAARADGVPVHAHSLGLRPAPDKQYLIGIAQLPAGASLDRTDAVIRQMSDIALKVPGIVDSVAFPGLSIAGFSAAPNEASSSSA
jgi:multidrug efflux pump